MLRNDAGSTGCGAEAELAGYAAKGFTAAKMCLVGRDGFSIANCVRRVKAARRGLGLNVELMIVTHSSLEVATAIKLAEEFASYDIAWFEEPVSPAWSTTKVWTVCRLIAEASVSVTS